MKKSVISVALMSLLAGISIAHADPVELFKNDYLQSQKTLRDPYGLNQTKSGVDVKTFDGKKNIDYEIVSYVTEELDEGLNVKANITEKGTAKLSSYKKNKGKVKINSELFLSLDLITGGKTVELFHLLEAGQLKAVFDNKRHSFVGEMDFGSQEVSLDFIQKIIGNDNELTSAVSFDDLNGKFDVNFSDDYKIIKAIDQRGSAKNIIFTLMDQSDKGFQLSMDNVTYLNKGNVDKLSYRNETIIKNSVIDIANGPNITTEKADFIGVVDKSGKEQVNVGVEFNVSDLLVDNAGADGGKGELGKFALKYGFNNIKVASFSEFIDQIVKLQALLDQDANFDVDEAEVIKLMQLMATMFSDESEFTINLHGEAGDADALSYQLSVKPSKALIDAFKNPVKSFENMGDKALAELVDLYLNELSFHLVVPDSYVITQYKNIKIIDDKDADLKQAEKEIKQGLMTMQIVASAGAPKGLTPFTRDAGSSIIDFKYKANQWTINGTEFTTAELEAMMAELPF